MTDPKKGLVMAAKKTKRIIVTQTGSAIRFDQTQKETLKCLGLGRIGRSVEHELTPSLAGMLRKVSHMIRVRELSLS